MKIEAARVGTLFRTELRMVLRDRRMILTSILLPLLVTPLMFLGSNWSLKKREHTLQSMVCRYAVAGTKPDAARSLLEATARRLESGTNAAAGSNTNRFHFSEVACADPRAALSRGEIQLILEGCSAGEIQPPKPSGRPSAQPGSTQKTNTLDRARPRLGAAADGADIAEDEGELAVASVPAIRLVFRADRDESSSALGRMRAALEETRRLERTRLLEAHGFPLRPAEVAPIHAVDLASKTQVAGLSLGRTITLLLLVFLLTGGAVVATDSLAGEKERGTLETLLTTAANRGEILVAKHLVILAVALIITLIQSANLLVYIGFKLLPVPANLAAAVPPWAAGLLFVLFLPVAALVSSVLLLVSGYARSYKEAQMYFMPVLLLGLLPALAPLLPGVPLRSAIVLVPVANLAVAAKEILIGSRDWLMIGLSWLITAGAAAWATRLGARCLLTEQRITAAETDVVEFTGGPALFERRVVRWFIMLWAVLLLVNNYFETADVRLQVFINLVVLFFGASCLMIRRYRLDPRAALALRMPRPQVWIGVLFAAPGGMLAALGLFELANLFLPMPPKLIEGFSDSVIPPSIPVWQLMLCLTVLPGVFEEIAFRGLLLHGLRRRLHPAMLVLVVGLAFGMFHVALFRFVPTACLGILLAAVTLLTGSIYPAMVWHCLNNALGILAYKLQIPENELEPVCYLAGAGMLAAAFWIFWRNRTPYPDLRRKRSVHHQPGTAR